jgi:hypothetical protein
MNYALVDPKIMLEKFSISPNSLQFQPMVLATRICRLGGDNNIVGAIAEPSRAATPHACTNDQREVIFNRNTQSHQSIAGRYENYSRYLPLKTMQARF